MAAENIVLIGFMGSGKSSIGRLIASKLRYRFVDTDQLVVSGTGMEISELFRLHGEAHFRDEERRALESLKNETRHVIATGGGIVTRLENRPALLELGFVVWLSANEDTIFERISRNTKRPLLQTPNPRETIANLLAERMPLYKSVAHFTIDTSTQSHNAIAEAVIAEGRRFFLRPESSTME